MAYFTFANVPHFGTLGSCLGPPLTSVEMPNCDCLGRCAHGLLHFFECSTRWHPGHLLPALGLPLARVGSQTATVLGGVRWLASTFRIFHFLAPWDPASCPRPPPSPGGIPNCDCIRRCAHGQFHFFECSTLWHPGLVPWAPLARAKALGTRGAGKACEAEDMGRERRT